MAEILGLSFIFPPGDAVGGRRFLNYIDLLKSLDHDMTIITCSKEVFYQTNIPVNESTLKDISEDNTIRIPYKKMPFILYKIYWLFYAVIAGMSTVQKKHTDKIFATGDPWFVLVASAFISLFTNTELIVDYRDPWYPSRNIDRGLWAKFIETFVLSRCSRAVFTTEKILDVYKQAYPQFTDKFIVIENGIDRDSMNNLPDMEFTWKDEDMLQFIFSGNIIPARQKPLQHLVESFKSLGHEIQSSLKLIFYTNTTQLIMNASKEYISANNIHINDYVPKEELYSAIKGCDICLMIDTSSLEIATKLIEYIALGKCVLAIIPENSANADFIRKYNAGWIVDINDDKSILITAIEEIYGKWKKNELYQVKEEQFTNFTFEDNRDKIEGLFTS